jgi:mycothiol synthase
MARGAARRHVARVIRPVSEADSERIAAFFAAAHERDSVVGAISAEHWRRFVAAPQNRGGRDFRLALEGDEIAGVATPSLRDHETPRIRHFRIVVAPERRRRGIASALLRHIAEMDAPQAVLLQCLCPERWEAMAGFLEASGFAVLENELEMLCDEANADMPELRHELTIRAVKETAPLAAALADIHNRAYAGTPSFVRLTGAEIAALFGEEATVLAAELNGVPAGFCHLELGRNESWVESVAVEPSRQRRGIGASLVAAALAEAARRAGPAVRLSVSDRNAAAYVVYRRAGFRVVAKSARYRAERDTVMAALMGRAKK